MPRTKSAKKALKQERKRQARNLWYKKRIREARIRIKKLTQEGKSKEVKVLLPLFYKFVDKAAKVGVIKKNKAARMKSKMSRSLAKG